MLSHGHAWDFDDFLWKHLIKAYNVYKSITLISYFVVTFYLCVNIYGPPYYTSIMLNALRDLDYMLKIILA